MDSGAGVIDIVGAHAEAVGSILDGSPADAISARSIPFLVECLAPLEMAHRGFIAANRALQTANADLELRTGQLQTANADLELRTGQLQTANADLELRIRERTPPAPDGQQGTRIVRLLGVPRPASPPAGD